MEDLHDRDGTLFVKRRRQPRESGQQGVVVDAEFTLPALPVPRHVGRTRHHDAEAARGA
jgi:hypothetical protein